MDATYDGGGWTLIATLSDDSQDTWTWEDRHLLDTDPATLGSLSDLDRDFKSHAYHDVLAAEVMFLHSPSAVWASYDLPTGPGTTLADSVADDGDPTAQTPGSGIPMNAGTLVAQYYLNEELLYFNVFDCDGTNENSYGPTWNATLNHPCQFDDPGSHGMGPTQVAPAVEANLYISGAYTGVVGLGFGWAAGHNNGARGTGENHLQVHTR